MKKFLIVSFILLTVCVIIMAAFHVTVNAADEGASSNAAISKKLDDILSNQKLIMDQVSSLKDELRIIKVRITQQQ